jgi:hypothetical protein
MSVGVTKDYKLKVRNLYASHTVTWLVLELGAPSKLSKFIFIMNSVIYFYLL